VIPKPPDFRLLRVEIQKRCAVKRENFR